MEFLKDKGLGLFLTRIVIAVIFLYHGLPKAMDWGMAAEKFASMGFPGFLGGIVGVVEVVAALLLITGYYFDWANYALAAIIVVAIVGVQIPNAMSAGKLLPAGLERDLLILVGNLVLIANGPGNWAVSHQK